MISCKPKMYEVDFDRIRALRKIPRAEWRNFEIDADGSFIRWPSVDIHLDLDAIRSVVDPAWRRRSERMRQAHGREYGAAISKLRHERGLKQNEIPGISERQLRRIEGTGEISVRTLKLLAHAHGMNLDRYLDELSERTGSRRASQDVKEHRA